MMGISIYKERGKVKVTVVCDGGHGLFGVPKKTFTEHDMNIRDHFLIDMPYRAGWGTSNKQGGRQWLCPACRKHSAS